MLHIHTQHNDQFSVMRIPGTQSDVIRFNISANLFSEKATKHPALLDQYAELLLSGTATYTREQITEQLEAIGTELAVNHDGSSLITISVTTLAANLKKTLSILDSICSEPTFAGKECTRVQKKFSHRYRDDMDNSRKRAYAQFSSTLFSKKHINYTPDIPAKQRDLPKTARAEFKALHRLFLARTWKVSVAADGEYIETVLRFCSKTHASEIDTDIPKNPAATIRDAATSYISMPSKANVDLCIGNVLPYTQSDPAFLPFAFGYNVLAKPGGFRGRLMSTVREKEGLTYMIYGRTRGVTKEVPGCWYIDTFFTPKDLEKGLTSTKREMANIIENGITQAELKTFKTLLYNQFRIVHESNTRMLTTYHNALLAGKTAEELRDDQERMAALTKKEVDSALRGAIDVEHLVISGAGPV